MEAQKTDDSGIDVEPTIKTPAGHHHKIEISLAWTIDQAIKVAADYFIDKGQLQAGDYNMVLVNPDGSTTELVGTSRVQDYTVTDQSELDLIVAIPQVDG